MSALRTGATSRRAVAAFVASTPVTLFFKNEAEFASCHARVGKLQVFFFCLTGTADNGAVAVATLKNASAWEDGARGGRPLRRNGGAGRVLATGQAGRRRQPTLFFAQRAD